MDDMEREVGEALEGSEAGLASPAQKAIAEEVVRGVVDSCLEPGTVNREPGTPLPARRLTAKEMLARKRNAQFAGVKTAEGKAISRLNARKHGVFATALTVLDRRELRLIHSDFEASAEPATTLEAAVVEKMALCWLRIQRCAKAEAELHQDVWLATPKQAFEQRNGLRQQDRRVGAAGFFKPDLFERLVERIHRYDTSLTNQFLRLMHELERLQRRRQGEQIDAPASADVNVTGT
jgi:hypothetical protein